MHTKILVAYSIISDKKNWSISDALRHQRLLFRWNHISMFVGDRL